MTDLFREKNRGASDARGSWLSVSLLALGLVFIGASWTPIGRVVSERMWTGEDSAIYSELRRQRHRSAYQSPARAGQSETEMKAQQERLEIQTEAMRKKLENAQQQPRRWSQYLLWSGALLTVIGGLSHLNSGR